MKVWAIIVDHLKDNWDNEYLFEDRLFLVGLTKDMMVEHLKCIINNPHNLLADKWEIDYDGWRFLHCSDCSDDCVLEIMLIHDSIKGSKRTFLQFRLMLLELYDNSTAQTSIPEELIQEVRDELIKYLPKEGCYQCGL